MCSYEFAHGFVHRNSPCCIVAAVGDGMSNTTGVSGRFFSALGSASINVLAIAQVTCVCAYFIFCSTLLGGTWVSWFNIHTCAKAYALTRLPCYVFWDLVQGCSERNISCVVEQHNGSRALRTVHAAFLLSHMVS